MTKTQFRIFDEARDNILVGPPEGVRIGPGELKDLVALARTMPGETARILLHRDPADLRHEMLIIHFAHRYIQPHVNHNGSKSYFMFGGRAAVVFFTNDGRIEERVEMGAAGETGDLIFAHRWERPRFHSLVLRSEWIAILETLGGPYLHTEYASWAPKPTDPAAADYFAWLRRECPGN